MRLLITNRAISTQNLLKENVFLEFAVSCPDNLKFVKDLIRDYSDEVIDNESGYIYSESA